MLAKILRKKKALFVCQLSDSALKIAKFTAGEASRTCQQLKLLVLSGDSGEAAVSAQVHKALKESGYRNDAVIVALPRSSATSRSMKVPSRNPKEIAKIVSLQAPRYFPYPAEELNSAFQLIHTDDKGYSLLSIAIAHRDIVQRYLNVFKGLNPASLKIILSSYGLTQLYRGITAEEAGTRVLVDIDTTQAEMAVSEAGKLLLSRSFSFNPTTPGWEGLVLAEINRTRDAYVKETGGQAPVKVKIFSHGQSCQSLIQAAKHAGGLSIEAVDFLPLLKLSGDSAALVAGSESSFAGIIGLGLEELPEELSLLPTLMKQELEVLSRRKEFMRLAIYLVAIVFILGLALAKNLDNKAAYLKRLKEELGKISQECLPLEEMEDRLKVLEKYSGQRLSSLDLIYTVNQALPQGVTLSSFIYEEPNELVLRGAAPELSYVFRLVADLQKAVSLRKFNVKVRYATKKRVVSGEIVDFEIACLKGK